MPKVAVEGHDIAVEAAPGEPILGALCRCGYTYRFGCRRGGCGVCKVQLVSGQVDYLKNVAETVLSNVERHEGICLTCRAIPITDVVIRLGSGDRLRTVALLRLGNADRCVPHHKAKATEENK